MATTFTHGYALLIGVGQSSYIPLSLPAATLDNSALQAVLTDPTLCGYPPNHICLLNNATRQDIFTGLKWLQGKAQGDPQATAIVYYSGHGWLDNTDQNYYLIPADINVFDIPVSGISAQTFTAELQKIKAQKLLTILDCCHAEAMASVKEEAHSSTTPPGFRKVSAKGQFDKLVKGTGVAILSSCDREQSSWVRRDRTCSIFTYHLIDALRGGDNQLGDTEVSVMNLINHLGKTVDDNAFAENQAHQEPQWEGKGSNSFPIALLRGGKGLPAGGFNAVENPPATPTNVTIAQGERSVAIGGSVHGTTIVTGDHNNVRGGNTQINRDNARGWQTTVTGGTAYIGENCINERENTNSPTPQFTEDVTRSGSKGFENVPGQMQPRKPQEYQCPQCDRTGYREDVSESPICPVHRIVMQPKGA
jgi:hypothetical protein